MIMCLYFVSFGNMNVNTYVFVQDFDHDFGSFFSMLIDQRLLVFYVQLEALKNRDIHMVEMLSILVETNDQIIPLTWLKNPNERLRKQWSNDL